MAELVFKLPQVLKRESGYLYYLTGKVKGEIDGIYRARMQHNKKKV